jgi:hypothetical protein
MFSNAPEKISSAAASALPVLDWQMQKSERKSVARKRMSGRVFICCTRISIREAEDIPVNAATYATWSADSHRVDLIWFARHLDRNILLNNRKLSGISVSQHGRQKRQFITCVPVFRLAPLENPLASCRPATKKASCLSGYRPSLAAGAFFRAADPNRRGRHVQVGERI